MVKIIYGYDRDIAGGSFFLVPVVFLTFFTALLFLVSRLDRYYWLVTAPGLLLCFLAAMWLFGSNAHARCGLEKAT